MGFQEFSKEGMVTYGNTYSHAERKLIPEVGPYDTQVLPPLDVTLAASTENQRRSLFRGCWEAIKIRLFNLTENVKAIYSEKLREGEIWEVTNQYIFFVNVFLRHVPVDERSKLVMAMSQDTRKPNLFDDSETRVSPRTDITVFGQKMIYPIGTMTPASTLHEALHYVQYKELMLPNHALTQAATHLHMIQTGMELLFDEPGKDGKKGYFGFVESKFDNKDDWLDLAINGETDRAFKQGYKIEGDEQLERYVKLEKKLDNRRMLVGELLRDQLGVKNPYNEARKLGRIRATRAAMLGWAAGDKDVAWTILWLNSLGYKFDDIERDFALAIKEGRADQLMNYYMYDEVRVEDLGMKNPRTRYLN